MKHSRIRFQNFFKLHTKTKIEDKENNSNIKTMIILTMTLTKAFRDWMIQQEELEDTGEDILYKHGDLLFKPVLISNTQIFEYYSCLNETIIILFLQGIDFIFGLLGLVLTSVIKGIERGLENGLSAA